MPRAPAKKSKYSPHPGLAKEEEYKLKFAAKTGRSFEEWVALTRRNGPTTGVSCRRWLAAEHGLGSRDAWWISTTALATEDDPGYSSPEALVDNLYRGEKAALRPLHEKVVDAALALGGDVIATSCKTMVPLYRKHVFAELRPVVGGVEVQFALGAMAPSGRFASTGMRNPGDRLTHRVVVATERDLDAEFAAALRVAYEHGAGTMKRAAAAKIPADLAKALKASRKAKATWDACTDAMRRDWILWIESAKQADTRTRRLGKALASLAAGRKKNY